VNGNGTIINKDIMNIVWYAEYWSSMTEFSMNANLKSSFLLELKIWADFILKQSFTLQLQSRSMESKNYGSFVSVAIF